MGNKIALITGATAGIGRATAKLFATYNYDVIITGRRQERLTELQNELSAYPISVLPLCFDVRFFDIEQLEYNLQYLLHICHHCRKYRTF